MKQNLFSFICIAALVLMPSCTTTGFNSKPTLPAAAIATSVLLSKTPVEARQAKAEKLVAIATAIEAVTAPGTDGAALSALVMELTGNNPEYTPYAIAIAAIYDTYAADIGSSNVTEITAALSAGIKLAASPYL